MLTSDMDKIKPPANLDMEVRDLPKAWKRWKEELKFYMELAMSNKEESVKVKMFQYHIGTKGREVYKALGQTNQSKLDKVLQAFDAHCDPKKNETVERYRFFTRNQESGESIDKYLTELKVLAESCNFGSLRDSLLRDRIVCGVRDSSLRERLLREMNLDLEKCLAISRATELSKERIKTLEQPGGTEVHAVHKQKRPATRKKTPRQAGKCKFCGLQHELVKEKCPAYGKECTKCHKKNHFAKQCRTKSARVHTVENDTSSDESYYELMTMDLIPEQVHTVEKSHATVWSNL